jgi:DNA-binding response OmpR family regulator
MENIKRVLLVEDEEDAREVIAHYLSQLFDVVDVATNGDEGFAKFLVNSKKELYYDVVITDIKMPGRDGLSMLEEITKVKKDQKFIIVSAHKDEEYLFRSINLNVISYFVKPLVVEELMDLLGKLIDDLAGTQKPGLIKLNDTYSYDNKKQLLYEGDTILYLSKKETLLVDFLISNRGEIKDNESLKEAVWNDPTTADATLRTLFKRVKDKIIKDDFVLSRKGRGYIIE